MPESIIKQYKAEIRQLARSVKTRYNLQLTLDELCSAAYQKLLEVVEADTYEPSCGEFWPYVYKTLRGAMIDEVEKLGRPRRQHALYKIARDATEASSKVEVNDARESFYEAMSFIESTGLAYGTWTEAQNLDTTPETELVASEEVRQLHECIERLPEHHRTMIRQRCLEESPLKTVAERFGITEQRASQMVAQAKAILREDMNDAPARNVPSPPRTQLHIRPPVE